MHTSGATLSERLEREGVASSASAASASRALRAVRFGFSFLLSSHRVEMAPTMTGAAILYSEAAVYTAEPSAKLVPSTEEG